ncbi:Helicase related protein [Candidatus Arthromitus sp. SFB-mouse-SU]|uniref:hypothetical protein n=1 Tax=unclassified Candidatus Neoarthromitus TaxID=2638829 RepID=UPI0002296974|nr:MULTISPECIES: hypothetical protein [unclassified Candidatus Arthromitus]EIA23475.1 Helicase related protein [Candidatus Arthromitus sp. SFB-1]EIA24961.1 Helicase related protein [Candidatus Arthromitus sp. SFB-2]EIA26845.1 Helicase related protein [Candidatus Arthromitus sp. SFB-5]EIA27402.1 Putative helicase related protein [Candidatus Arthromitus sp. SFB-4]EIA28211.1 Helicase related protein [Candidatus Arthromitus sp. SFB-co]EIA30098.1 Helicase related protein [Candidatus Arthromitus sp
MGNVNVSTKADQSKRKGILKKAALLATVASITSAAAIGNQKPKESEALIGAIIGIVSTVIGVATGIGQTAADIVSQQKAAEEARRAEEEARRQAEEQARQERMREQLETSAEHNVRLAEQEVSDSKEINISIADNSSLQESQALGHAMRSKGGLQKPSSPPKGINVGGFGASDEVEENDEIQNIVEEDASDEYVEEIVDDFVEEIHDEVVEESLQESFDVDNSVDESYESNEGEVVETKKTETITKKINLNKNSLIQSNKKSPTKVETNVSNNGISIDIGNSLDDEDDSPSNVIRFDINEKEDDDGIIYEEILINSGTNKNKYDGVEVGVSDDMLMSTEDAENHHLVKDGYLSAEDLILLDFAIRSGAITGEILDIMYDNGDISDEYYGAGLSLIEEIAQR